MRSNGTSRALSFALAAGLIVFAFADGVARADVTHISLPGQAQGLAVAPNGHVLVGVRGNATLREYSSDGALIGSKSLPIYPWDVDVDSSGNIYVAGATSVLATPSTIRKFEPDMDPLWSLAGNVESIDLIGSRLYFPALFPTKKIVGVNLGTGASEVELPGEFSDLAGTAGGEVLATNSLGVWVYSQALVEQGQISMPVDEAGVGMNGGIVASGPGTDVFMTGQSAFRIHQVDRDGVKSGDALLTGEKTDIEMDPTGVVWALVGGSTLVRIDRETPAAEIEISTEISETGDQVEFDASESAVPFATVTKYEWDFDGDGSYETDSAVDATVFHRYEARGVFDPVVRVTAPSGAQATATKRIAVRQASRQGPIGASINDEAVYTNDPEVELSLRWPDFAESALISNDGGFANAKTKDVNDQIPWKLVESGLERLPKTVYVRFRGGRSGPETYQDDIILDQTPPVIESAQVAGASASSVPAHVLDPTLALASGSRKRPGKLLRIRAKDKTSGVKSMRVTGRRSKPGKWKPFKSKVKLNFGGSRAFVQVRDRAGNPSKWKTFKR